MAEDAWERWTGVLAGAVTGHVAGSAALGWVGRHRAWAQRGMPRAMVLDSAATVVGLTAQWAAERLRGAAPAGGAAGHDRSARAVRAARLVALGGAGGSIAAQGYLAEQQRIVRSLRKARPWGSSSGMVDPVLPVAGGLRDVGLAAWWLDRATACLLAMVVVLEAHLVELLRPLSAVEGALGRFRPQA